MDKALQIDPNNVVALTNKGIVLDRLGDYANSIQYLDKALSIEPNSLVALANKGRFLADLGKSNESRIL